MAFSPVFYVLLSTNTPTGGGHKEQSVSRFTVCTLLQKLPSIHIDDQKSETSEAFRGENKLYGSALIQSWMIIILDTSVTETFI